MTAVVTVAPLPDMRFVTHRFTLLASLYTVDGRLTKGYV